MKIRIDKYLVDSGKITSREKAQRTIMAGLVYIANIQVNKVSEKYTEEQLENIIIKGKESPYVSRAGLKLEKAINQWEIDLGGKNMLDVGSSTGGFTDCALQKGINHVVALDVGTNQLVYELRINKQVDVHEKTNFRKIDNNFFDYKFDLITMDVSFISVKLLIERVAFYLKEDGQFICLIKPQFEAERSVKRNSKGVIIDYKVYKIIINQIIEKFNQHNIFINKITTSPIKGTKGNIEFLTQCSKIDANITKDDIDKVIESAIGGL